VLADPAPQAFAVPGHGGHIVVSSGMLASLSAAERRVLLAHERAHLRAGHHWHTGLSQVAAAINPALRPVRTATGFLCERWADEIAAVQVDDRGLAATALARAALAAAGRPPVLRPGLGYHGTGVGARVTALRRPPRRPGAVVCLSLALALLGLGIADIAADVHATGDFLRLAAAFLPG
jgi:beta-lactamase regulating signal transducer with metallopeptidase domain